MADRMFGYFVHFAGRQTVADNDLDNVIKLEDDEEPISCLKWMARPGDGVIVGYRTHYLRYIGFSTMCDNIGD